MSTRNRSSLIQTALFTGATALVGVLSFVGLGPSGKADSADLVQGGAARAFEQRFDAAFPAHQFAINLWAAIDYLAFNEGRPGVVVGRDGWLYTSEEFDVAEDQATIVEENLARIAAAKKTLAAEGVGLVIALVPQKASVYAEHLGRTRVPESRIALRQHLLEWLAQEKIMTVDLLASLNAGKPATAMFFHTDTHWTPAGAKLAAEAIGAEIVRGGLRSAAAQSYITQNKGSTDREGDLLNFLPLAPAFAHWLPPHEAIDLLETTAEAAPAAGGDGGLFGDAPAPNVALVGTSYSANAAWHFAGYLEQVIGEPIANYAKEGLGPFTPMSAYLAGEDFHAHKPRLVIWEIPERALARRPQTNAAKPGAAVR